MKIVQSLVKQIGGELHILPGDNGCGCVLRSHFDLQVAEDRVSV